MALNFLKKLGEKLFGKTGGKPSPSHSNGAGPARGQGQKPRANGTSHPARKVAHPSGQRPQRQQAQQPQASGDSTRRQSPAQGAAQATAQAAPQQRRRQRQQQGERQPRDERQEARRAAIAADAAEKAARTPSRTVTASADPNGERPRRGGRRDGRGAERGSRRGDRSARRPHHDLPPTADELKSKAPAAAADPDWTIDRFVVEPAEGKKRFHDFDLPVEIMHAISDLGFKYCTPIQAESLSLALEGRNVAGRAQTGTGKTAAFLVAILTRFFRNPESRSDKPATPRALVIAPTRELVIQICRDAEALGRYCGMRCIAVYGGMDYNLQLRDLQQGPVDLLVATPGRLIDYQKQHAVDLSRVDTLVIDEADRMLDMGFIPDVRKIIRCLPPREQRRTMLYSATLTDDVMNLAAQWMPDPVKIEIDADPTTATTIQQHVYITTTEQKFTLLCNLLKRFDGQRVLIFCNRRVTTDRLALEIDRQGFTCEVLSGDVDQRRRLRVIEAFRSGTIKIVVATDVAGRGLHIADIGLVVNYELPYEAEDYVHRIGRTGRAGNVGTAVSFADPDESFVIPDIEEYIGEELKCDMPEEELLAPLPPPSQRRHRRRNADHPAEAGAAAPADAAPAPSEAPAETAADPATPAADAADPARTAAPADAPARDDAPAPAEPAAQPATTAEPAPARPAQPAPAAENTTTAAIAASAPASRRKRHGNQSPLPRSAIEKFGPPPVIPGPRPEPQEWTPGQS